MNPLNMNPKMAHILMEFVQIGGTIGALSGILGSINPILGTACGVIAGIATVVKTNIVGNIPASTTTPPTP